MRVLKDRTLSSASVPQSIDFDPGSAIARHTAWIESQDSSLRSCLAHYVEMRLNPSGEPPVIAAVAAALAEPFDCTSRDDIELIVLATICCDHFSHVADDVADSQPTNSELMVHCASLLLARAGALFARVVGSNELFWRKWQDYLADASEGERHLWRYRDQPVPFAPQDFGMLAKRGGLIRAAACAYACLSKKSHLLPAFEEGLGDLAVGAQLIDDLLDWDEDIQARRFTYPLVLAAARAGSTDPLSLREFRVFRSVTREISNLSIGYLDSAKNVFSRHGSAVLSELVVTIETELSRAVKILLAGPVSVGPRPHLSDLRKLVAPRLQH